MENIFRAMKYIKNGFEYKVDGLITWKNDWSIKEHLRDKLRI